MHQITNPHMFPPKYFLLLKKEKKKERKKRDVETRDELGVVGHLSHTS